MKRLFLLLLSITIPDMIDAQTPPMPPVPTPITEPWRNQLLPGHAWQTNIVTNTSIIVSMVKTIPVGPLFSFTCTNCHQYHRGQPAMNITTNSWRDTPDDKRIIDRTVVLKCTNGPCSCVMKAANQKVIALLPNPIATEDEPLPMGGPGGASVLPDTNAPIVTITNFGQSRITDFTNQVPVSYSIDTRGFYWLDAQTGQQVTKAFEFRFQAHSNHFYTAWICSPLSERASNWVEYPIPQNLHPARGDFLAGISIPIYETNRFYAVRSFAGGNRVTWQ